MASATQTRVLLCQQRLNEATEEARRVLEKCKEGGVQQDLFLGCQIKLKQRLAALEKEVHHLLNLNDNINIESATTDQMTAEDVLNELELTIQLNNTGNEKKSSSVAAKLPKLQLPQFNGDKLKWTEFWDRFRSNVHCQEIADADKLAYLKDRLTGPALEVVTGITGCDANYKVAVDILHKRFGSKDVLVDAHYCALYTISKAEYNGESCRRVLDEVEQHLRILEQLGEPINGNHLRSVLLSKFPERVLHEHHLINEDNSTAAIRQSLQKIVTAIEKSGQSSTSYDNKPISSTEALHMKVLRKPRLNLKRKSNVSFSNVTTSDTHPPPAKRKRKPCLFCKLTNHASADCRKYRTVEMRKDKLGSRCHKCLRRNHTTDSCKRKISCFRCKGEHLLIFCRKQSHGESSHDVTNLKTICEKTHSFTFLQTAVALVQNPEDKTTHKTSRLLMDSGSQRSYVTEDVAKSLKLPIMKEDLLLIYTFGASEPQRTSSPSTILNIQTKRGINKQIQVNIVPRITDHIPVATLKPDDVNIIDILADDDTTGDGIDLLIGNDYYSSFLRDEKVKIGAKLYLLDTDFGWVLSGNVSSEETCDVLSVVTYCQCHTPSCPYFTEPDLPLRTIDMKFLWSLETIGITDSPKATRQDEAINHFNETVEHKDGRYQVKWPWIQYPPDLPSNFGLAIGRLRNILKRLDKEAIHEYDSILKEQLELGIIEAVNQDGTNRSEHPCHYLPHHIVKQKGKSGRIVYDASAKPTGSRSLNECLYSGPSMIEDLTALLLKFRTKKIGITADVEKAFLQVALQDEDRDVTRFLWIKDTSKEPTDDNLLYLRFCRVPFGVISSPFLLTATIRHHMNKAEDPLLKKIADECYVDNLVTGADSIEEAVQLYKQTRSSFEEMSMNIRDWMSNDKQFLEMVPESHRATNTGNIKVLGLDWNTEEDLLKLRITGNHFNTETSVVTKRTVLRSLARIYDPCGFVCPLILPMKMIFQEICARKFKWDKQLPEDVVQNVKVALDRLKDTLCIALPRYVGIDPPAGGDTKYYLHAFTDASKHAYASVVYLKAVNGEKSSVALLMAKSHVSQISDKENNIPRLELLGFLIGSRLLRYVKNNLDLTIQKEYLWTDSLVVLSWMKSHKLLPPFVANRVNEIKLNHAQTEMCYISTKSNPADIATRPELFEQKKELWFNGPKFLQESENLWPENRHYDTDKAFFSVGEALGVSPDEPMGSLEDNDDPIESVVYNEDPSEPMEISDTHSEDREATDTQENDVSESVSEIKKLQSKHFLDELSGKITSLARNLRLFLDVDGILRCRGRMANANWSYDMKYPILLPKNSEFTDKIMKAVHEKSYHVGASHTLNIIREKYWIPSGKAQVQRVIRRCPQCIKHGGGPYKLPATPALPPERVNYYAPFTFTGMDYLGPLYVKTSAGQEKRWVALFTCLTVRAIHLEIVNDLSANECHLALRRFMATRGTPKRIYSDNATYFKLVSEVMTATYVSDEKLQWKFIPQLAPWHGGFYERLVALVKHCLKRTLEKHLISDSQMQTVLKEVETVLNSRPLTRVGNEVEHILRPANFLSLGKCLSVDSSSVTTPVSSTSIKIHLIDSWKRGLKIMEEFKKMFIGQYLTSLRERYNHEPKQPRIKSHRAPQIGDLVQIKADHKNRNQWKVGKIESLIKGSDGECRVARVRVEDTILTRSIGHLFPLEADTEKDEDQVSDFRSDVLMPEFHNETTGQDTRVEDNAAEGNASVVDVPVDVAPVDKASVDDTPIDDFPVEDTPADNTPVTTTEVMPPVEPEQQIQGARSKRDAATRAREKILEWTRHLLAVLQ